MKNQLLSIVLLVVLALAPSNAGDFSGASLAKGRSNNGSFNWPSKSTTPFLTKSIDQTLFSQKNEPGTAGQAEWIGFLNGWMMVAVPIPLPFLVAALALNSVILLHSKWNETIKNKYLIGFSHGVAVLVVFLRELEAKVNSSAEGVSPRVAAMGFNLATTILFGHSGSHPMTKTIMNVSIYTTMLYILVRYFS